jgi:low temperature requirement protein LtrA
MLQVMLVIIVVGVVLWLATTYIPMDATIKRILVAVVIICLVLWLLQVFGVLGMVNTPVPQIHR